MRQITEIGKEPTQTLQLVAEDNTRIDFKLFYKPTQESWYFDLSYEPENFSLNGVKLVNSPNILRQYINIIPFGISCIVEDGTDPYFLDDFTSGRAVINLLTETETEQVEINLYV